MTWFFLVPVLINTVYSIFFMKLFGVKHYIRQGILFPWQFLGSCLFITTVLFRDSQVVSMLCGVSFGMPTLWTSWLLDRLFH